ncbi:hypothetical protein Scep_003754 [Stephania cephalantha]|uniref:Uncharacterized protein n=1 Tax=Stephania cephalantha TaxID=152367 RepID=A0AAP0PW22_9MAGN
MFLLDKNYKSGQNQRPLKTTNLRFVAEHINDRLRRQETDSDVAESEQRNCRTTDIRVDDDVKIAESTASKQRNRHSEHQGADWVWCPAAAAADLVWVCSGGSDLVCNDVQRRMCGNRSDCASDEEQRLQGGRGRRKWSEGAVQRWTSDGDEGQASLQDGDAVVGATPGSDAGDQRDATSANSSDSGEPPTRTTNASATKFTTAAAGAEAVAAADWATVCERTRGGACETEVTMRENNRVTRGGVGQSDGRETTFTWKTMLCHTQPDDRLKTKTHD